MFDSSLFPRISGKQAALALGVMAASLLAGFAANYLPGYIFTLAFGLGLLLFVLYFPLFPTVPFGPVEFSASTPIAVGLAAASFLKMRRALVNPLARWQWAILFALGSAFLLATMLSANISVSLRAVPNLVVYLLLLFSVMTLADTFQKLTALARLIIVLGFVLSIWRTELGPIRGLFGLSSLGINGAVFNFHTAAALALVVSVFSSLSPAFSMRWRIFSLLALLSLIAHGVLLQTRAAWLAWAVLAILVFLWARGRDRLAIAMIAIAAAALIFFGFRESVSVGISQTQTTLDILTGQQQYGMSSGDLIRERAREAGWRMFLDRPVFGWGPNQFQALKPFYVTVQSKESRNPNAFNAWLIYLAEMGAATVLLVALAFLAPLLIVLRARRRDPLGILAFGFALGALAIGIHLLFIDLFYSFAWTHLGLALAAARMTQTAHQPESAAPS